MARSREEKAASHERIVAVAARQIRERGLDGPGVAEIMRAAGLTHGGFYKHFASREDLIAEAAQRALTERGPDIEEVVAGAEDPLAAFASWYASTTHRDDPGHGCGVAALGNDMPRAGERVKDLYRVQVERYLDLLEGLVDGPDEAARAQAAVAVSALVGAVVLARALGPTERSDQLLADVREAVGAGRPAA